MPRGKRKVRLADPIVDQDETVQVVDLKEALCNHRNMHYTAGVLTCVLPPKHGGDHVGYVNDKITAWSDAAGTPIKKHG
jgi:hypothetical protein